MVPLYTVSSLLDSTLRATREKGRCTLACCTPMSLQISHGLPKLSVRGLPLLQFHSKDPESTSYPIITPQHQSPHPRVSENIPEAIGRKKRRTAIRSADVDISVKSQADITSKRLEKCRLNLV